MTNETVAPLYLEQTRSLFTDSDTLILKDGEQYKTLETVTEIYDKLLRDKFDRDTTVVALGGGVIGDLTGFAAATFMRGVHFLQVPTTLLAQVDSSVGGKTGVNHPLGKNMIGAFHQPKCVIADMAVLETLPERELRAGLAEVIKYGLINHVEFFHWLQKNREGLLRGDSELMAIAVKTSCEQKAAIVAQDEREGGVRALLNLGHTFGHAIETNVGYGNWLHGEAVATGMVMAADLSMRMGWLGQDNALQIKNLLQEYGLPVAPPADITEKQYLETMLSDKKARAGVVRFVLMKELGEAVITDAVKAEHLSQTLSAGPGLCQY